MERRGGLRTVHPCDVLSWSWPSRRWLAGTACGDRRAVRHRGLHRSCVRAEAPDPEDCSAALEAVQPGHRRSSGGAGGRSGVPERGKRPTRATAEACQDEADTLVVGARGVRGLASAPPAASPPPTSEHGRTALSRRRSRSIRALAPARPVGDPPASPLAGAADVVGDVALLRTPANDGWRRPARRQRPSAGALVDRVAGRSTAAGSGDARARSSRGSPPGATWSGADRAFGYDASATMTNVRRRRHRRRVHPADRLQQPPDLRRSSSMSCGGRRDRAAAATRRPRCSPRWPSGSLSWRVGCSAQPRAPGSARGIAARAPTRRRSRSRSSRLLGSRSCASSPIDAEQDRLAPSGFPDARVIGTGRSTLRDRPCIALWRTSASAVA